MSVTGSDWICPSGQENYLVKNIPPGASVSWSIAPQNNISLTTTGATTVQVQNTGANGWHTLSAIVTTSCTADTVNYSVWAGQGKITISHTPVDLSDPALYYTVNAAFTPPSLPLNLNGEMEWIITDKDANDYTVYTYNDYLTFTEYVFKVKLTVQAKCGPVSATKHIRTVNNGYGAAYTGTAVNISTPNASALKTGKPAVNIDRVNIFDESGRIVVKQKPDAKANQYSISLPSAKQGQYYAVLIQNEKVISVCPFTVN